MATSQGFLEESHNENSIETTSTPGAVEESVLTGRGTRAMSSPAILEPSKDEFRYQDTGAVPTEKRRTHSCPQNLSEETPLNPNAELSVHEESEQISEEDQVEERRSYYTDFYNGCLDAIVLFRKSKLIHVVQILFFPLPISAIVMGLLYVDKCPYLPILGAIKGLVGTIFIGLWIAMTVLQQRGTPFYDHQKFTICFIFLSLVLLEIIDVSVVGPMSPSFTKGDKNYCNKEFYEYCIKKEILTGVAFVLAAIFYLPRSRHYLCCCTCCSSQPLIPNVEYLSI